VVGRRFPARARVGLYLGAKRLKTLRANRRGRFRVRVKVPAVAPRLYRLTARARGVRVRARFRLLATPKRPAPAKAAAPAPAPPPPPPPAPATLVAAGDIACKAGDAVTATTCRQGEVSNLVLGLNPDVVATLGDAQYEKGELANYQSVFDPSWGRFKAKIRPAAGNHEYLEQSNHQTAAGHFTYFGSAAGDPAKGYYDYTIGNWHAFVLNTGDLGFGVADCFPVSCAVGSAQEQWLRTELAKLPADACVVGYLHHPRYSSETSVEHTEVSPLYDALYDYGAELLLTSHSHTYERFVPMDAAEGIDASYGVRQFVVGTGGRSHTSPPVQRAGSEFLDKTDFGALELKLSPASYTFRFLAEDGTVKDSGSGGCHRPHS
jgi:hypothetical protein